MSGESDTELQCDDDFSEQSIINLQNGLGCMRKRKKKAIIRWHNFNIEKEPEKHFRSCIMLFMPWREENKLHGNYKSYTDRYHDEIDKIKKVEDLFIHHNKKSTMLLNNCKLLVPHKMPGATWHQEQKNHNN